MESSHKAETLNKTTTTGGVTKMFTPRWPLRVAIGLAIATVAGVLSLATTAPAADAAGPGQIVVQASGATGEEEMLLRINGVDTARWRVSKAPKAYIHEVDAPLEVVSVDVAFLNDNGPRDLTVEHINLGGAVVSSNSPHTTSSGTYVGNDGGCRTRPAVSAVLHCNGAFTYTVPAGTIIGRPASSGPVVNVRAIGRSGGEQMDVLVNGTVVASASMGTAWQTVTAHLDAQTTVATAEVRFSNDRGSRDLRVDYLEIDGRKYEAESPETVSDGFYNNGCRDEEPSSSEWLYCRGGFRFNVDSAQPVVPERTTVSEAAPDTTSVVPAPVKPVDTTTIAPAVPAAPAKPATQSLSQPKPSSGDKAVNGRYSITQVIDGTIGAGDGGNPNEESPMGRHEAPLYLPQGWNWAQGPTRNSVWGKLGTGGSRFAEWRCAVIPENGHRPSVPFRINVRNGAYYQFVNNDWKKGFDVDLTGGNHGGYLGQAGRTNSDPFSSGSKGRINWRRESDGSFSAPWNPDALMMHFWAAQRKAPAAGQTAEFLTSEVRLQQPDGRNVDLSGVKVLFQCGVDYYNNTGGQGTKVPGPGIAKYSRATTEWRPGLWITLPGNAPAASSDDFRRWLEQNTPPNVGG